MNTTSTCPGAPFRLILTVFSVGQEVSKITTYINRHYHPKINIILKNALRGKREYLILVQYDLVCLALGLVRRKKMKHEYDCLRSK